MSIGTGISQIIESKIRREFRPYLLVLTKFLNNWLVFVNCIQVF